MNHIPNFQFSLALLPLVVVVCFFAFWLFSKRKWVAAVTAAVLCLALGGVFYFLFPVFNATSMPLGILFCFLIPLFFLRHRRSVLIVVAVFCVVWHVIASFYSPPFAKYMLFWLTNLAVCAVALCPVVLRNKPGCIAMFVALCLAAIGAWHVGKGEWIWLVAGWLTPLLTCAVAWPVLRRNRAWVVAAAVACLTPCIVPSTYLGAYHVPLVLAPPDYLAAAGTSLAWAVGTLVFMPLQAVPVALPIGVIAWLLCEKYLPPPSSPSANGEAGVKPHSS